MNFVSKAKQQYNFFRNEDNDLFRIEGSCILGASNRTRQDVRLYHNREFYPPLLRSRGV
jgi:hypothetical protein